MKSIWLCLLVICAIVVAGCDKQETSLADEGITEDDIAKYEAELAAVSGDAAYEDAEEVDETE